MLAANTLMKTVLNGPGKGKTNIILCNSYIQVFSSQLYRYKGTSLGCSFGISLHSTCELEKPVSLIKALLFDVTAGV